MSKVVADNKLPNKSVNGLPYGLFTPRLQNNSSVQDICLYRCVTVYRVYLVIYLKWLTWGVIWLFALRLQNNSPFKDICLYRCHCFQHYLVINFSGDWPVHCIVLVPTLKTFTSVLTLLVHNLRSDMTHTFSF